MSICWRSLALSAALTVACAKPPPQPAAQLAPQAPAEVEPEEEGPIAGPRNLVEQAPPQLDPDLPGRGPLVAYMGAVRTEVMPPFRSCWAQASSAPAQQPALLSALIAPDGEVVDVTLARVSGSGALDACALEAFGEATLPPPPAEILNATLVGTDTPALSTPGMAFVPSVP